MTWMIPREAVLEDVGGTYVIINEHHDCAIMNNTASTILHMLLEHQDEASIAHSLALRYEIEEDKALEDVMIVIEKLLEHNMMSEVQ